MTQEEPESMSSEEMELSKPWSEVVRLGQRIVRDLALTRDFDTLARWMAHRVAELMDQAEHAESAEQRELAKRECTDVIIRLWDHRASRSHGRPLAEIADFLQKFTSTARESYRSPLKSVDSTWIDILPHLIQLNEREVEVCRAAALAGISLEYDQEWLQEHADDLSDDEKQIIHSTIDLQEVIGSMYFGLSDFVSLPPEQRTAHALQTLAGIESERQSLLNAVRQSGGYPNEESLSSGEPLEAVDNEDL